MATALAHVESGPAVAQPVTGPAVQQPVTGSAVVTGPTARRPARECADCRYSEIYAEQPRVLCTCADSPFTGKAVFSGQPICSAATPRSGDELSLAWCTPGRKVMHSRFVCVPPRL